MRTRKSEARGATARVIIHRRKGTLYVSQGGTTTVGYISPRFQNPEEAQAYYEQQGYVVTGINKSRVTLVKYERKG
jgi:hypothetical protein